MESGFGQYLIDRGHITDQELAAGLQEQALTGDRIGEVLVRRGNLTEDKLIETLSSYLGIPGISLTQVKVDPAIAQTVSEELARRYLLIPISVQGGVMRVAMADPTNIRALDDVRLFTGYQIEPVLASAAEIRAAIRSDLTVSQSVAEIKDPAGELFEERTVWLLDQPRRSPAGEDGPIVRLVDSILQEAVEMRASDIHWEPRADGLIVRYRLDGQLEAKHRVGPTAARSVAARLKVMAGLDVAERRLPQDGRISLQSDGRYIDLRISTLPTVFGEKIVVRLLDPETAQRSLDLLGMRREVEAQMRLLLQRPHGLILVTGPTGSGKTTTLYALLRELQGQSLNIVSIEDPVEYTLENVNQVPVNTTTGLTFAKGLRAILRQDPDVIMIGEIRDQETARIATAAALTGHLVLSTLHTNTAAEALTRLLDMGIEPYLLASAVSAVLAQRLVRVLCPNCRVAYQPPVTEKQALRLPDTVQQLYRPQPQGCKHCRNTGYAGRIGIHELLLYNQDIKELVLQRHSFQEIEDRAIASGMLTLAEDGMRKAVQGITSVEEVMRSALGVD